MIFRDFRNWIFKGSSVPDCHNSIKTRFLVVLMVTQVCVNSEHFAFKAPSNHFIKSSFHTQNTPTNKKQISETFETICFVSIIRLQNLHKNIRLSVSSHYLPSSTNNQSTKLLSYQKCQVSNCFKQPKIFVFSVT